MLIAESVGSAQSHNNCFQTNYDSKMLITPERKVPKRSDAMQKSDTGALGIRLFIRLFKIRLNSPNKKRVDF